MRLPAGMLTICEYDVAALLASLPPAADELWDLNTFRQKSLRFQNHTRSIVFEWLDNGWKPGTEPAVETRNDAPPALTDAVYACAETLRTHRPGRIAKLMLAELGVGGEIARHRDAVPALTCAHRCHVPLVTDRRVRFTVDDTVHFLEPGTAYELDNTRYHSVVNASESPRVHLICDILP